MNTDRFKFRVWDEVINQYRKEGTIQLSGNGQPFIINGDMEVEGIEDVIIEQCTGLRDKNGILIFEGDVVKKTYKDGTNLCTEVFYNTELCRWYLRKPYPNLHAVEYMVWDFCGSMADSLEVIGNIHEDQFREVTKLVDGKDSE